MNCSRSLIADGARGHRARDGGQIDDVDHAVAVHVSANIVAGLPEFFTERCLDDRKIGAVHNPVGVDVAGHHCTAEKYGCSSSATIGNRRQEEIVEKRSSLISDSTHLSVVRISPTHSP